MNVSLHLIAILASALLAGGCSTDRLGMPRAASGIHGESLVMVGEQPTQLAFPPFRSNPIFVRSHYLENAPQVTWYQEGRDFVLDLKRGTIARTPHSRIPDFRTNILFGIDDFNHGNFPGFGNGKFFVYVDYTPKAKIQWVQQQTQIQFLEKTRSKLARGEKLKIVAFGDSITAGGDATSTDLIFWQRWADLLQHKYPNARIEAINGATGGDTTVNGLHRLSQKVLNQKPDVVLVGFGMNDHNVAGYGVPVEQFAANLATIVDLIRKETDAEILLYSTFPPNPKWHFGSHNMEAYAAATESVAREKQCAFADIYRNWKTILSKKKPEDLLGNNINHPNDFGHWIYFKVLCEIGL